MSLGEILVSTEDMKDTKDTKIVPFKKYFDAVERAGMIKWIKENIEKRSDKTIVAKVSDVAKEMGHDFEESNPMTIYNGLKYVLFQNDIVLGIGFHTKGDRVFIMKEKKPEDKLPLSYKRMEYRTVRKAKKDEKYSEGLNAKYEQILKEKDEVKKERAEIRREKDSIYEEFLRERNVLEEEFRKEKKSMQETIKRLKDELGRKREKRNCIVEVFKINWKTLEWKLIRQKMAKTEDTLLSVVREFTSKSPEDRFRIEVTEITGNIETEEGENTGKEIDIEKIAKIGEKPVVEIPEKPKIEELKTGEKDIGIKTEELETGEKKADIKTEELETVEKKSDIKTEELETIEKKAGIKTEELETGEKKADIKTEELETGEKKADIKTEKSKGDN